MTAAGANAAGDAPVPVANAATQGAGRELSPVANAARQGVAGAVTAAGQAPLQSAGAGAVVTPPAGAVPRSAAAGSALGALASGGAGHALEPLGKAAAQALPSAGGGTLGKAAAQALPSAGGGSLGKVAAQALASAGGGDGGILNRISGAIDHAGARGNPGAGVLATVIKSAAGSVTGVLTPESGVKHALGAAARVLPPALQGAIVRMGNAVLAAGSSAASAHALEPLRSWLLPAARETARGGVRTALATSPRATALGVLPGAPAVAGTIASTQAVGHASARPVGASGCPVSGLQGLLGKGCDARIPPGPSVPARSSLRLAPAAGPAPWAQRSSAGAGARAAPGTGSAPLGLLPSPAPSGLSGSAAALGFAASIFFIVAVLSTLAAPRAMRRFRLLSEPQLAVRFVLIPERPG